MHRTALYLILPVLGQIAVAENVGQPLSAIDWLSDSVETAPGQPQLREPPIADAVATPDISVTSLDQPTLDQLGLLSPATTGLPTTLWSASPPDTLASLVTALPVNTLPALQSLTRMLLLAEAQPPLGAGPEAQLFYARIDKLLDIGALDPAQALIGGVDAPTRRTFRRSFDIDLLLGQEDHACQVLSRRPDLAPTVPARIFCRARNGDWAAAALTLNTAIALGDLSPAEEELLLHFLDPSHSEEAGPLPRPPRPSPLTFRIYEAVGDQLDTTDLPRAFANADLRSVSGWRSQLQAAERLIGAGAIDPNAFFAIYADDRRPAASGGVWDRVSAIQKLDRAISSGSDDAIGLALPTAWEAMRQIHAEAAFAARYTDALIEADLNDEAAALALRIALLSDRYEERALSAAGTDPATRLLAAIAMGKSAPTSTPAEQAVAAAFGGARPPRALQADLNDGKLGEAVLKAIALFHDSRDGDPSGITGALALLRQAGLEDAARRAALQYLILDHEL
ncbi:hypothetical protein AAD018_006605 [Aestuariibius insulae]|uniref:hypothetical protein n=1 Tax=Aestuariibius insulae TaxID=2058287 RepID=UPI00345EEAE0